MKRMSRLASIFSIFSYSAHPGRPPPAVNRPALFSDSLMVMEETVTSTQTLIAQWDVSDTPLFCDDASVARQYIQSVLDLHTVMQRLIELDSNSELLLRAHNLMRTAMKRLEHEFRRILSSNFGHGSDLKLNTSVSSLSSARLSLSDQTGGGSMSEDEFSRLGDDQELVGSGPERSDWESSVADVKAIVECMIAAGYGKECIGLYKSIRKSIVDEEFCRLGILEIKSPKKKKKKNKKKDWEALEKEIKRWLIAVKVAVRSIIRRERTLSSRVFSSSPKFGTSCFSEVTRDSATRVFQFADFLARRLKKASPGRIFSVLDTYEAITDLWPELESVFPSNILTSVLQPHMERALSRLRVAARSMLISFESSVQKESSKDKVPGGGVHPLTKIAMNYLTFLADYGDVLRDIIADWPLVVKSPLSDWFRPTSDGINSVASTRLAWLILVLLCKLDRKGELYKGNVALSNLFLANNLQYVVDMVCDSNLRYHLGEEWISSHESKVKQYAANYERMGWSEVFSSLALLNQPKGRVSMDQAGDMFRSFNAAFEATYWKQVTWVVPNPKLRNHVRASLDERLGSVYREVLPRWAEFGESIVRFAPDDVDNYLSELFCTSCGAGSVMSSCSS